MTAHSLGKQSLTELFGYKSTGSLPLKHLPDPDRKDYFGTTPRWYAETIAQWLLDNPYYLGRVERAHPEFIEEYVRPLR